ncbi:MAG: acetate/propionate family kinase [Bryobacterales bacterium]|nr:acetate/propionate family kinase [Acidobacteriota bacterium]MCB9383897.1 acetate/propionate family kinase [Bryobacterales bacterium]
MRILIPNLGSTSFKYQLLEFPTETVLARGRMERIGRPGGDAPDYRTAIERVLADCGAVDGVGFKAVHAGPNFRGTFAVDDAFLAALEEYALAAPLHNSIYLTGIRAFRELRPDLPLVAVVEPGFHRTMPDYASSYGVPQEWAEKHGVRRYGFHGSSHNFISRRALEFLGVPRESLRVVSCHLGGSSSMTAIDRGRSVDTTMGFSPQSGLENATRHGDLDPFAVLFLMDRLGWSTAEAREQLLAHGGLAGVSGVAGGDVRDVEEAARAGNGRARLALDLFCYEIRKTIGAYAAAMGGLDAIVFTGGIGENSALVRALATKDLEFLGVRIDPVSNVSGKGDRLISYDEAPVKAAVLATNEEIVVGRETARLLA